MKKNINKINDKKVNKKSEVYKEKNNIKKDIEKKETLKNFHEKIYIGYNIRVLLYSLLTIIFLVLSIVFFTNSFIINPEKKINYSLDGKSDYSVYLKENNFYEDDYLGSGMNYVANLIDNILINFQYDFNSSEPLDASFIYNIDVKLNIYSENNNKLFYEKKYKIIENKEINILQNDNYIINEEIEIDYDKYNQISNEFKSNYNISTKSELVVSMDIVGMLTDSNYSIDKKSLSIIIPLSQKSVDISIKNDNINISDIVIQQSNLLFNKKSYVFITIILLVIMIYFLVKTIKYILKPLAKKTKYNKYINRILVEYDRLIVESRFFPNLEKYTVIKIDKFEELLDVRDNLKQPIMYFNVSTDEKCHFYILNDRNLYLVTIKAVDINKK